MISFHIVAARFDSLLIRVDMFVHQTWKESRLKLPNDIFEEGDDYVTLPPEFFDNMWQPDPYILNSKVAGECGRGERGVCEAQLSLTYAEIDLSSVKTKTPRKYVRNCHANAQVLVGDAV